MPFHMTIGERIRILRNRRALTQGELGDEVGVGQNAVSAWESGERHPGRASTKKLATFFMVSEEWLRYGMESTSTKKQSKLVGFVGAGDLVHMLPEDVVDWVDAPPTEQDRELEALEVRGNSQFPVFRDKYKVFYDPTQSLDPKQLIGEDCIVELGDGRIYLKTLAYGSEPGLYTLRSYNAPEIVDVKVRKVAEIVWIQPCRRKQ